MDKATSVSFCYSKAAGLLSKAFIKERAGLLFQQETLTDLWNLLFKETVPLVPEVMLAEQIEKKAFSNFINQYLYLLGQFDNPSPVLLDKLKEFEVENLKVIVDALAENEQSIPELIDLKKFSKLNTKAWPNIAKITEKTNYSWIKSVPDIHHQQEVEFMLDMQLLKETWAALEKLHGEEKIAHQKLFLNEYKIKNIIWALRLKLFYEMPDEEIVEHLFFVTDKPNNKDPLANPALKVLKFDLEKYSDWENWEFKEFLNPHEPGEVWRVDPSWIERRYMAHQAVVADHIFHQNPMEEVALAAWFEIKSYELTCIRTAVESLRLHISSDEAMEAVGVNG